MHNKETSTPERREPYPSEWVRFEYDGNFSQRVIFDQELVGQMIRIIGAIPYPLIIAEWKQTRSISIKEGQKGNNFAIMCIDSEAFDRKIKEAQQRYPKGSGQKVYENTFCAMLKESISMMLSKWAEQTVTLGSNRKFMEKVRAKVALKTFFKANRDRLVSIKDQN